METPQRQNVLSLPALSCLEFEVVAAIPKIKTRISKLPTLHCGIHVITKFLDFMFAWLIVMPSRCNRGTIFVLIVTTTSLLLDLL